MKILPNEKFLLIGDSITDVNRDASGEETAWAAEPGFGKGYVNLLNALIHSDNPAADVRMMNRGVGGDTVRALKARWQRDVLDLEPDWLSICIGVNDVWRQFDSPRRVEMHVYPDEYEATYDELLERTRPQLKGLLLVTPFFLEPNRQDAMRQAMDAYGQIVTVLAKKYDAQLIDAQAALDRLMTHMHPMSLAWDRIHLNTVGHMALAQAIYKAIK